MSDQTIELIKLLKEGKTCNEICSQLKISNKQLFNNLTNLRNKGLFYRRKYYSNGEIVYRPIPTNKEIQEYLQNESNTIITSHDEENLKCLVISDLHYGNELQRPDLVNRAMDYCIKNNIHIIFLCGDIIDGSHTAGRQIISDIYFQIESFIKNYPFDKNILTFGIGGDHDASGIRSSYQSIIEIVKNYRHDIALGAYFSSCINIKNDKILLTHIPVTGYKDVPLILRGHRHKYIIDKITNGRLLVTVPSLSNINESFPTAVELNLTFKKGYIEFTNLKQIYFGDKDYILSEIEHDLLSCREVEYMPTKNEDIPITSSKSIDFSLKEDPTEEEQKEPTKKTEDEPKTLVKKLQHNSIIGDKDDKSLSQIDKFNRRYGIK